MAINKKKRSPRKRASLAKIQKISTNFYLMTLKPRSQNKNREEMKPYKQRLVEFVIRSIGGSDPVFVMEKEITQTDMSDHHDRITFPRAAFKNMFLSEEEDEKLSEENRKVILIEPTLNALSYVSFTKWKMGKNMMYVINGGWKHVAKREENCLKHGSKVQLWPFRVSNYLCFILTKVGF